MGHDEMKMEMIQCLTTHLDDEIHDEMEVKESDMVDLYCIHNLKEE